ncbi:retroviral-like aspartic protease family protein [Thalassomonas viridans]|uniref:Retroviral-like aspartic protease family protein n=1 Tax=Thalassomonas viridans TaxID=137584 RepID=A0AAE9Z4W4_9GAMM|nr:aspartyl protease family protein [Thalassomonas viridans]WDE06791.1 retroviral-like aspartic protease family protein [Thalassomonas viridans]
MTRYFLFILLALSLTLNGYFYLRLQAPDSPAGKLFSSATSAGNTQTLATANSKPATGSNQNKSRQQTNASAGTEIIAANKIPGLLAQIKVLVQNEAYYDALALFVDLNQEYPAEALPLRESWLTYIDNLLSVKRFNSAELFLQAYLHSYPDDVAFLSLQVDFFQAKRQVEQAIGHAYDLLYHILDYQQKIDYLHAARNRVTAESEILLQRQDWQALAELCQQVLALDPEFYDIQLLLARAEYEQDYLAAAESNARPLLELPQLASRAQSLLDKINAAYDQPSRIPLIQEGEHYIVRGLINREHPVALMLDTGASISLLSQDTFDLLGLADQAGFVKTIRLNTAGGVINAGLYRVSSFDINGYTLEDMHFAVSPYFSSEHDGLLGMNYLGRFNFYIDQADKSLKLETKSP